MPKYKLLIGSHTTGGKTYYRGDILDISEAQAEKLGDRLKNIDEIEETRVEPELEERVTNPISDLEPVVAPSDTYKDILSKSVAEIRSAVANISDLQVLNAIREEEIAGKQRLGVLKVIRSRQEELNG